MAGISLATGLVAAVAALSVDPAQAQEPLTFASCADLRQHLESRAPYEEVRLAPSTYICEQPIHLAIDGLSVDFGGSTIRVADNALRPGVLLGDLHTPPARRHKDIRASNVVVDGNRANQAHECWGGPCDPVRNTDPLWQQRVNGITVNGCDDCVVVNAEIDAARSGGVVVVSSNRLLVDGLIARGSHFDGLAGYWTRDSVFRNILVHDNDYAGFSFDLNFSDNRIEDFEARDNGDQGVFIRLAQGNSFVNGRFADNGKNGVYFDRARADLAPTCASDTRFERVTISGSGQFGAWLNFECEGNRFVASQLLDNHDGCFGGREAIRIGKSDDTVCGGPETEQTVDAIPSTDQG
ncbi:MAG: right-handed parallel beta-helix repeat-containing protein [Pseudomonadota bacterium]